MKKHKFTLIIPSLNPDEKLSQTIQNAIEAGIGDIILVDDGSDAEYKKHFIELDQKYSEVALLTHNKNLGKGAALKTAFTYFLENRQNSDGVVTADADGQHKIEDIISCAEEMMRDRHAIVLGCRDFGLKNVPPKSRFGNKATSLVFRLFFGMGISDTQTGLRAIPAEYVSEMLEIKGTRYEYETNMLIFIGGHNIPYREVKIETLYFDDNSATHFRPIRDSIRVYGLIFKYAANSLASALVDILMFYLLGQFLFTGGGRIAVLLSTVAARVVSSIVNFALNKRFVFDNRSGFIKTFAKYVCLAVPVMLISWLSVYALSHAMKTGQLGRTLWKALIDTVLFIVSFRVQRSWVFTDKN